MKQVRRNYLSLLNKNVTNKHGLQCQVLVRFPVLQNKHQICNLREGLNSETSKLYSKIIFDFFKCISHQLQLQYFKKTTRTINFFI